jgi:hypothetical protein
MARQPAVHLLSRRRVGAAEARFRRPERHVEARAVRRASSKAQYAEHKRLKKA